MTTVAKRTCTIEGCARSVRSHSLCYPHLDESRRGLPEYSCDIQDCLEPARLSRKCKRHYQQARRASTAKPDCLVEDCGSPGEAVGLCKAHYRRQRLGVALDAPFRKSPSYTSSAMARPWKRCGITGCTEHRLSNGACVKHSKKMDPYGFTVMQLDWVLRIKQCEICNLQFDGETVRVIDHDHACHPGSRACSECVRGVICGACNSGLGFFRDNPDSLLSAVKYLAR